MTLRTPQVRTQRRLLGQRRPHITMSHSASHATALLTSTPHSLQPPPLPLQHQEVNLLNLQLKQLGTDHSAAQRRMADMEAEVRD